MPVRELIQIGNLPDLQVLEVCKELWTWIVNNPDTRCGKVDWPGWEKYDYCNNHCPCCEKAGRIRSRNIERPHCEVCLLKDQFKVGKYIRGSKFFYCEHYTGSPWLHYRNVETSKFKKKWAQKMVDITNEAIKELKGHPRCQ